VLKEAMVEAPEPVQWSCYPLPGTKVMSPFGRRGGRRHTGVDLKTVNKDNILAAFAGEVVFSGRFSGYGNLVRIRHENGLETYYSHNSKNLVKVGDQVKAGQVIALVGQTGRASTPHLHFETRIGGQAVNPNRFFDHVTHSIRLEAFNKKRDGYVIKR
jgi:murein DD-endopeptidase MepM/ murein hydrolase activator NlpD